MKKILLIVMNVVLVLTLSACSGESEKMHKEIENIAEDMMKCVQDKDVEGIYEFFDSYTKESGETEIKKQLQDLFDFIDGEIVSYDYYYEGGGSRGKTDGKVYIYLCTPEYRNVLTSTGKNYTISFYYHFIDDEHPEHVGLIFLKIIDTDEPERYMKAGIEHDFSDY